MNVRPPWRHFAEAAAAGTAGEPADANGAAADRDRAGMRLLQAARQAARAGSSAGPAAAVQADPLDLRLATAAGLCWATALGLPHAPRGSAFALAGLLFAAVLAILLRTVLRPGGSAARAVFLVLCSAAALLCLVVGLRQAERLSGPIRQAVEAEATVTVEMVALSDAAKVESGRAAGAGRYRLRAEIREAAAGGYRFEAATPVLVIADSSWAPARYGDELAASGKLVPAAGAGAADALLLASTRFHRSGVPPLAASINSLRQGFMDAVAGLPADARALLPGMVLGDRSAQPEDLAEAMRRAGLAHLLAVSGANCSYVLGFVYVLAAACRLPRPARGLLGLAALSGFVLLVRPEPSVLRAAVMGSIGVLALLAGRRRVSLAFLCLSVIVLLLVDPWLAASYGFLLSVLATMGLVLFGGGCSRWLQRFLPKPLADAVSLPLAAQVLCGPALVLLQPGLPAYSVAANVLAAPVVPAVTIAGMAAVVLAPVWPGAAIAAVQLAGWLSLWVAGVARTVGGWPGAVLPWPPGVPGAALALLAGLLLLVLLRQAARLPPGGGAWLVSAWLRPRVSGRPAAAGIRGFHGSVRSGRRRCIVRFVALGVAAAVAASAAAMLFRPGAGALSWTLAACNVGQGDGLVLNAGGGAAVVVDTGPDPDLMDGCLRRLRVDRIEVLVLTHMHLDHYGGLAGVLGHRSVGRVLAGGSEEKLPGQVRSALAAAGATVQRGSAGMAGVAGNVRWEILWPVPGRPPPEENDASLVLGIRAGPGPEPGLSMLLTGDMESEAAASLLMRLGTALPAADVLKISHHGARNGGTGLIEALRPKAALISVGRGNGYGHPAPEIIAALQRDRVPVFRTDLLGTILLDYRDGQLQVAALR